MEDNSKLDLYLLFHDDPDLLALLEDPQADASWTPSEQPPAPSVPVREPPGGVDASPGSPGAGVPGAARDEGEDAWHSLLEELDQLVTDASGQVKPELPPSTPEGVQSGAYDYDGFDDLLPAQKRFVFPPITDETDGDFHTDDDGPVVFENAAPFDGEDPLARPAAYEGAPFPYGDRADEDQQEQETDGEQAKPPTRAKRIAAVAFNIVFFLLCFALVAGSAVFAFSGDENKSYLGLRFFNVLSESMTPRPGLNGFNKDDIIIVKVVTDPSTIKEDDIVTVRQPNDIYLTHRVVDIRTEDSKLSFVLRGNTSDGEQTVSADYLVGKVVLVLPGMGAVLSYVRNNLLLVIIFIVALFAFSILLRSLFLSNVKTKRRKLRNRKSMKGASQNE